MLKFAERVDLGQSFGVFGDFCRRGNFWGRACVV